MDAPGAGFHLGMATRKRFMEAIDGPAVCPRLFFWKMNGAGNNHDSSQKIFQEVREIFTWSAHGSIPFSMTISGPGGLNGFQQDAMYLR
ncbi:MAG: hypothetical protein HW380_2058 [Magnetococcales bacterium]|nr:hypothetical protein [Magnetococcales bacterium]